MPEQFQTGEADDEWHGRYSLRCVMCKRVYAEIQMPHVGDFVVWESPSYIVPCHADGFEVAPGSMDPFERVVRLLDGKGISTGGKFTFSIQTMDNMLVAFSIKRG